MMTEDRLLRPEDRIYDLVDVVDDETPPESKPDQEIIVIDGRIYERVLKPEDVIYDLEDVLEEGPGVNSGKEVINKEIIKIATEAAERIAREIIPGIAERVILAEIEKLKREDGEGA